MMNTPTRFWDRMAPGYSRKPVADEAAYQRKLEITREFLRPEMRVLELGCGTGTTAIAHAPHVREVVATDFSEGMLEIARTKASEAGTSNVRFDVIDVNTFRAPEEKFDVVLALSLLHLVEDRDRTIREIHDTLVPGGLFVSNTACITGWLRAAAPFFAIGRRLGLLPLVRFFSSRELVGSLEAAGFSIEHKWRSGPRAAVFIVARRVD